MPASVTMLVKIPSGGRDETITVGGAGHAGGNFIEAAKSGGRSVGSAHTEA